MVVINKSNQLLLVDHQEETTTHHFQKSCEEPPPVVPQRKQKFERVLANLTVDLDYPGFALDVSATREAMIASSDSVSKSKMLRLFRMMKEKQRVYEYYRNQNNNAFNDEIDVLEFKRPGSDEKEQRDISEDYWNDNTNKEDVCVRDNIEEDPRDKEDIYLEDRPRSNLVALDSLVLTYPCIQDTAHSLKVK